MRRHDYRVMSAIAKPKDGSTQEFRSSTLSESCVSKSTTKQKTQKLLERGNKSKTRNKQSRGSCLVMCCRVPSIPSFLHGTVLPAQVTNITPLKLEPLSLYRGSISRPGKSTNAAKTWGRGRCCGERLQGTRDGYRIIKESSSWIMTSVSGWFGGIKRARC
jgi:hypothetical protein